MSVKLKLEGFDDLLREIEKAGRSAESAALSAMKQSAEIVQNELKSEMKSSNVDGGLISRMPPYEIQNNHGEISAHIGYKKGDYNPNNPSDGYKAVFLNYGTPRRSEHGKIKDRSDGGVVRLGWIDRAKRKAKPKVKKAQEEALKKILARLKK